MKNAIIIQNRLLDVEKCTNTIVNEKRGFEKKIQIINEFCDLVDNMEPVNFYLKDEEITDVIFRKDTRKKFNNTIYALFPHDVETYTGEICAYTLVGQHCSVDYNHCINTSKLATKNEYKDLKNQLELIGYNLNIIKKQNKKKYLNSYYQAYGQK